MQKQVSRLPAKSSYWLYHQIMRWSGAYKVFYDPTENFKLSRNIFETVSQFNDDARDKTFLEIGTGRVISTPLGLWLLGAQRITTIDINPFLREEVILKSIDYIRRNRVEIEKLFGEHAKNQYFKKRLKLLISAPKSLSEIFKLTNIEYLCPVEGTSLPLGNNSVDVYYSTSVLEHIPPNIIKDILSEAKRILSDDGLIVHFIHLADHFGPLPQEYCGDPSISTVNFLQFSEEQWKILAGNRFSYHNRLRAYEFNDLFKTSGIQFLDFKKIVDHSALNFLSNSSTFQLNHRFMNHSPEELSIAKLYFVGKFCIA